MSLPVYLRVGTVTVIIYSLSPTPQIAGIIQYLIMSPSSKYFIISRHLSHSYQKERAIKAPSAPYCIYMRPQPLGNGTIGEPRLEKHQMMIGASDIFRERFVRMLSVQINQACSPSVRYRSNVYYDKSCASSRHSTCFPTLILSKFLHTIGGNKIDYGSNTKSMFFNT